MSYLDASHTVPPETITTNGVVTTNLAFMLWKRQDKLIYSALSRLPFNILSTTTTFSQVWSTLASTYAKPSRGQLKQLKQQLHNIGQKDLKQLTSMFKDSQIIAVLGKPINHEDQINPINEGLPKSTDQWLTRSSPHYMPPWYAKIYPCIYVSCKPHKK